MKKTTSLFCAFAIALGLCSTAQAFIITFNEEQNVGEATTYFYWTYECNETTKTATLIKGEQLFEDVEIKNLIVISDATTTNLYTVNKIAAGALANNPALLSVTVPNTILEIGDEVFRDCTSLAEVTLTYGIRYIGRQPFVNTIVREIKLPDSVIDVGGNIAAGTLFTTTINIEDSSHFVYSDDGVLYNKDQTKLYACPARAEGTVSIPNTVTNIAADAFFGCFRLTYLNLPKTVNTIGGGAFNVAGIWPDLSAPESTPKLKSVFYNGSVPDAADDIYDGAPTELVSYALNDAWGGMTEWKDRPVIIIDSPNPPILSFIDHDRITWFYRIANNEIEIINEDTDGNPIAAVSPVTTTGVDYKESDESTIKRRALKVPGSINGFAVTKIGPHAFDGCTALTCLGIPATVREIADGAFTECAAISSIDSIDNVPFDCEANTIVLPTGVTKLGYRPFDGLTVSAVSLPYTLSQIDGNPIAGCAYVMSLSIDATCPSFCSEDNILYSKRKDTVVAVPSNYNGDTVSFPSSIKNIGDEALFGCANIESIHFPSELKTIGNRAFANCSGLETISLPSKVQSIGGNAFLNCSQLTSISFDGDAPTSVGADPFEGTPADMIVYVPQDNTSFGPVPGIWHDRETRYDPGYEYKHTDDNGTTWTFTVYKSRAELGTSDSTPVVPASTSGEVSVPGEITIDGKIYTITSIADGAFEGCSEITAINIPASITTIAADAFNGCTSLESVTVDSKNPAYSSRNGILYSKDGRTLVKVPAKTSFAATFTEQETATKKDIVEVIGSTDPTTMTTDPNQIIELKSYGTSTTTTTTEFFPAVSIDKILSGVTAISDYAFTDCGLMPKGSTVSGTMVVKVNGKETGRKTGKFELPVGTDSTGGHANSYINSQAGFYKGSVCLYHTASDSDKMVSYAIPINIPTGISYGNLAFYNSHFTSKNKSDTPLQNPPVVVVNPPVDEPDDDLDDTDDGFGVRPYLVDANGNLSAIEEGDVIEAHVGIMLSIPLSVGNAPDGSLSTVTAKGLPAGVKLAKTAVKEGRKVVKYIYTIEGTPSRAQSAKAVVLKVTNRKNKLNKSVSFAIKVLAMPSWVGGKYNGVCFDGTTEIGSATATISAAGKLSGTIMVPSDDGKKSLKLRYTAKGFSGFDEESNTFYGTAAMRINKQTVDVPFALSAYDGAGQLSLELPGMTAALEQNTWKRGDIVATTIEVDGFKFKLSANGKVKWSGSVEGDNGRMLSVSGSTQLLSGPSVLVYIPPKSNLVGGRCELFQLQ